MERKELYLTGEKELKIFMHPLRQRLLRLLSLEGPATPKSLADRLEITPSSAKHHLARLESLGLVAPHHTQLIRGITATYYQSCPVTVRLGLEREEGIDQRQLLAENLLMEVYRGFRDYTEAHRDGAGDHRQPAAELMTGVAHLTPQDAQRLYEGIRAFVELHDQPGEDTVPYEYGLVAYPARQQR